MDVLDAAYGWHAELVEEEALEKLIEMNPVSRSYNY